MGEPTGAGGTGPQSRADYERAAAAGDASAMFDLGYLLEKSDPPDRAGATEWYERAAAAGNTKAYFRLGFVLDKSDDVRDQRTAIGWYEKAAELGDAVAMYNIGIIASERLDPPEFDTARTWFERSAKAEYPDAYFRLAYLLSDCIEPRDNVTAVHWYEKAAATGDASAMNNIALLLRFRIEPHDLDAARAWYERATAAGHTGAPYELGSIHEFDLNDYPAARRWYEKAAAAGNTKAYFRLGYLCAQKLEPRDPQAARGWYEKAAELGNVNALYNLGHLLRYTLDPPDIPAARRYFVRAADKDDTDALYELGLIDEMDPAGYPSARRWYEQAAEAGNTKAYFRLGYMFVNRIEPRDLAAAQYWYEKSAAAGVTNAAFNLGHLHRYTMQPPDLATARTWFERAAEGDDVDAFYELGRLADLAPADPATARGWYEKAAATGHTKAAFELGYLLSTVIEPHDYATARTWYEQAAGAGHSEAAFELAYMLAEKVEPRDVPAARTWYKKAAESGHKIAMFNLGQLHRFTLEPKDLAAARVWYERSAEAGYPRAAYELGLLAKADNDPMALIWFERAAAGGHATAMNDIGHLLWSRGAGRNAAAASAWFARSAAGGNDTARSNLVIVGATQEAPEPVVGTRTVAATALPRPVPAAELGLPAPETATGVAAVLDAALEDAPHRRNAFRLAGLRTDADGRGLRRRVTELEASERLGTPLARAGLLPPVPEPDPGEVKTALNQLREPLQRLVQELFWLWPTDGVDPGAPGANMESAERIWLDALRQDPIAAHNIAVVRHVQALESELGTRIETWLDALTAWDVAIGAAATWQRLRERAEKIGDNRLGTPALAELRHALPAALLRIHSDLIVRAALDGDQAGADLHVDVLTRFAEQIGNAPSVFDAATIEAARDAAVRKLAARTGAFTAEPARIADNEPTGAVAAADRLLDSAQLPLLVIDRLRPTPDAIVNGLHDDIARSAMSAAAAEFNETRSAAPTITILERVAVVASTPAVRDKLAGDWAILARFRVDELCVAARKTLDEDPKQAAQAARDLLAAAGEQLVRMRMVPAPDDELIVRAQDRIASTVTNCAVGYFNETGELETTRELLDRIRPMAQSTETKDYVREQDSTLGKITQRRAEAQRLVDTCWFCEQRPAAEAAKFEAGLHRDVVRRGNTRSWKTLNVDVPRCAECREEHRPGERLSTIGTLLGLVGFLAGFFGGLISLSDGHPPGAIVAAVIGVPMAIIGVAMAMSPSARATPERAYKYPRVLELMSDGWLKGARP
ncbi:tetratricopeptide repeat protein [Nocardia stercoris]|uniref:Sel1 repeat family protein n=1 Tax=Nocardia stercoris TaxID=2483361 RepID=A0A3M2KTY7_9NOCA|nr:tetratricopeptide repeat protein [Nocardia stercoris]RMI29112.1 sel1 repeat family protein [Nocardia stercoris]